MTETARRKRRKGPSATRHRQGMTPAKIQGQRKVILAPNGISARHSAAAKSRIAPWCPRVSSILRRSLHAARSIHERSETALCAARAPPRRRFESAVGERVFLKTLHLRRTSSSVNGDDHRTSERSGGRDRRRFHDRDLNGRVPKSALAEPLKSPSSSPGRSASQLRRGRERLENKKLNRFKDIRGAAGGGSCQEPRTGPPNRAFHH